MNTDHYDWDEIFKYCADILSKSLAVDINPISKVSELYKEFRRCYWNEGRRNEIPQEVTFQKKLHSQLKISYKQRIYKSMLYQLVGKYQEMTIPALANYLTTPYDNANDNSSYLFYRIKRGERTISENKRILYATANQLKQHFKGKIIFLSYDDDTIVIMCSDNNAKKIIRNYINKCISDSMGD